MARRGRRSLRENALALWAVWTLFGAYSVFEGATNHNDDGRLGMQMLVIAALPALGAAGLWYARQRLADHGHERRPASPIAVSREPIPAGLRFAVLRRDGFRCAYCGRGEPEGVQLHIDHLIPLARGGRTEFDNLVTACAACNLGKSASDLVGPAG